MKRKSLIALTTGLFSFAAIALSGSLILNNSGFLRSFVAHGEPDQGSYTITAADFPVSGNGSISVGGEIWNYEGATISGSTVSISGVFYTNTFSGADAADGRRGDGYTRMVINGFDKSSAVGLVVYEKSVTQAVKNTITDVTADLDLTIGGTIDGKDRRGLQFAQGAGGSFSFTSMTLYYACTAVTPEVHINETSLTVGVGETATVSTSVSDVYPSDVKTFAFSSSDENIATVDEYGVVTGVAAGNATITVTMTVNGHDYTDSLEIEVTAAAATIVEMSTLDSSRIQGAGLFCMFNPSTGGVTAAQLNDFTRTTTVEFADPNTQNAVNFVNYQDTFDNSYTAYIVMNSAVGLNNAFTVTSDFRDNANNKIYRAVWHFDNGTLDTEIHLSASGFSVNEGEDLEITASKASWLEGTATFSFESLDTSVFTVAAVDNVATVTGVAEGSATLRITMNVAGVGAFSMDKTIAVTQSGVQHDIPWYTEGTGNQANHWLGAGIWTWVNYGSLGYTWAQFSQIKAQITVSYASEPSTTVTVDTISDDLGSAQSARVYILAGAAYNTGVLTMSLPDVNGITYTGTIEFNAGVAVAYNGVAI